MSESQGDSTVNEVKNPALPRAYPYARLQFAAVPVSDSLFAGSGLFVLLKVAVLFGGAMLIVNGVFPQFEMALLGGRAPISPAVVKAGVLFIFMLVFFFRAGRMRANQRLVTAALIFAAYLFFDMLHLYFDLGIKLSDVLLGYNVYYTPIFIAVIGALIPLRIPERYVMGMMLFFAVPCAILGGAQVLLNKSFVRTESTDGNFTVPVFGDGAGGIRAFSLFNEPQHHGLFFVFITAFLIALCRRRKYRYLAIPLIPISLAECLAANSRTQLAGLGWGILAALVLTFWRRPDRIRWLPGLAALSAIPLIFLALTFGSTSAQGTVNRTQSLYERLDAWTYYINILKSIGMNQLLFGLGWVQNGKLETINTTIPMDDLYITITIHIGLIGLACYLVFAWSIWRELLKSVEREPSYLQIAVAATYSTFFLMGVFNNVPTSLPAYFLLVAMSLKYVSPATHSVPVGESAGGRGTETSEQPRLPLPQSPAIAGWPKNGRS
jgi:hypothetical protein